MGIVTFLRNIGQLQKSNNPAPINSNPGNYPVEYVRTMSFNKAFKDLLSQDQFIARSDYKDLVEQYRDLSQFYATLVQSNILNEYAAKHNLDIEAINYFRAKFDEMVDLATESPTIRKHNDAYISHHIESEKPYLDNILKACDPAISLDREQREVVLSEEDHTLVIAGAGAGKTTTVAAKVRYLVEKRGIDPSQILVISFTNKAVEELRGRINGNLGIPCPISTFHSIGYTILRRGEEERKKIVEGGYMYTVINNYLKSSVLRNPEVVDKLILFFGSYFTAPYEGEKLNEYFQFVAKADCSTLKGNLHEYVQRIVDRKTLKTQTLNNEILRSMEEVRIANFLYMYQSQEHYRVWRKDNFGMEDPSKDKPAYFHAPESSAGNPQAPEMISAKANPATKKKAEIYTIGYSERMIEKDGFKVIVDANGDILTDMQLLAKLRTLRQTIAQENGVVASRILYDSVLVLLATDRPLSREEFIDIKGITISTYMRIGERFIAEIKKHVES